MGAFRNEKIPIPETQLKLWRSALGDNNLELLRLILAYCDTVLNGGKAQDLSEFSDMGKLLYNAAYPVIDGLMQWRKREEQKGHKPKQEASPEQNKPSYSNTNKPPCSDANKPPYSAPKEKEKHNANPDVEQDLKKNSALSDARAKNTRDTRTRKKTGPPPEHFSNSQESPLTENNESITGEEDNINAGHSVSGGVEENSFDTGGNSEEENHEDENGSTPGSVYHPDNPPDYPEDHATIYEAAVNQGYHISPEETAKFFSNFASVGWIDKNRDKIRDWKKVLLSWTKNQSPEQKEIGDRLYREYCKNGGFGPPDEIQVLDGHSEPK